MSTSPEQSKRRSLLSAAIRYPVLGAVALLAGRLAGRPGDRGGPLHPDEKCTNESVCRGCRSLGACRSPQAAMFRDAEEKGAAGRRERARR
jgi:hypothetical protein